MNHSGSASAPAAPDLTFVPVMSYWNSVDQLVADHVIGRLDRAGERQDDPALVGFGHPAGTLPQFTLDRVGLPKVRRACVQNEGLAPAQLVVQELGQPGVPTLGHPRGHLGRLFFLRVVIDVEVVGFQNLELEIPVLHLVSPEIPRLGEGGSGQPDQDKQGCRNESFNVHKVARCATDVPVTVEIHPVIQSGMCRGSAGPPPRPRPVMRTPMSFLLSTGVLKIGC